ncbi:DUF1588 domain-containing protein [Archangium violaceum]|uniref:DUF1588 domain-containing protein n=1 Tax=Archangium violaceum TaxID=83451 RepID=UPI0035E3E630
MSVFRVVSRACVTAMLLVLGACTEDPPKGPDTSDGGSDGGTSPSAACHVLETLQTRCSGCHGATPTGGAPMALTSLDDLRRPSPKDASRTTAQRSLARMQDTALPMPPAPAPASTPDEVASLSAWIGAGMPACSESDGGTSGPVSSPNLIPQEELFACQGATSDATTRLRRISRWQWTRNVGGSVTRGWTGFSFYDNPLDPNPRSPYGTYAADDTVDESMVEIILPIVDEYGATWAGPYTGSNRLDLLREDRSLRCMWEQAKPNASCIRNYLATLLERGVLYRPARADELDRLAAFTESVLAQEVSDGGQGPRTHSLSRVVTAASLSAGALFREEMGKPLDNGRVELGEWELAQQLAYALGDRGPGAVPTWRWPYTSAPSIGHYGDIANAARDGGIRLPEVVGSLIERHTGGVDATRFDLVQDFGDEDRPRRGEYWLSDGVANFFRQWLGYTEVEAIFKERPEATSAYDDGDPSGYRAQASAWENLLSGYYGYESTLIQQMDDFVARAVVGDAEVLKTLLTSRRFFLAATRDSGFDGNATRYTGQPYGTTAEIAATNEARWRMLPEKERAGVLTHPAWLASHGGNFEDDPSAVHRGKWVRENLLCGYVPPLSEVRVMAQVGPHAPNKNARARLEEATGKNECQGCHSLMNPLGYAFEIYNHAGYLRTRDHSPEGGWMAPTGQVTLINLPDPALNGAVRDAVELSEKLAASGYVKRCFIRHAFRYYMGRDENRSDACTLARMEQAYDQKNGSFKAMLSALMTSDTWTTRRQPAQGE